VKGKEEMERKGTVGREGKGRREEAGKRVIPESAPDLYSIFNLLYFQAIVV